jgi:cell pole-organizing protein PopZ
VGNLKDGGRDFGMSQTAKAQEPSMEEILASIRRIIADDDGGKPAKAAEPAPSKPPAAAAAAASRPPPAPAPPPPAPPPPAAERNAQSDIDAMLAELDPPRPEQQPEPEPEPPPLPAATDVLELTEDNVAPSPGPVPTFRTIDGDSDIVFAEPAPEPPPSPPPVTQAMEEEPSAPEPPPSQPDYSLISNDTATAVDSAFNALAHTILGQNARTLEDLVKEMLRPMLKSWLDDNLPGMVERIVRAEIERVSRGKP